MTRNTADPSWFLRAQRLPSWCGLAGAGMDLGVVGPWARAGVAPPRYVAAQGTAIGRAGRVFVEQAEGEIWIGGSSVTCVDGIVHL